MAGYRYSLGYKPPTTTALWSKFLKNWWFNCCPAIKTDGHSVLNTTLSSFAPKLQPRHHTTICNCQRPSWTDEFIKGIMSGSYYNDKRFTFVSKELFSGQIQAWCWWCGTIAAQVRCVQPWGLLQMVCGRHGDPIALKHAKQVNPIFPVSVKLGEKTEPSSIWQGIYHVQTITLGTSLMEQQEGFLWFKESRAMEKHDRLLKSEQSFSSSDCCFDKEGWIQTTELTKPTIYFKGILIQNGKKTPPD